MIQRTNASGNVIHSYRFTAFGVELISPENNGAISTNPWRFAGEYWDSHTQTYYLRARHFNPRTGRFLTPDPHFNMLAGNMIFGDSPTLRNDRFVPSIHAILQSGNLYMYTMHNPVFFNDPDGLAAVPAAAVAAPASIATPVILIVGGVVIVATLAYLSTPEGQQMLADASWALVDGVEIVGAALSSFADTISGLANNIRQVFKRSSSSSAAQQIADGGGGTAAPPPPQRGVGGHGWRGDSTWRNDVNTVRGGGTINDLNGRIPTVSEALDLIMEAGGTPLRTELPHSAPNPHNFYHINFTTPSGAKGTIQVLPFTP